MDYTYLFHFFFALLIPPAWLLILSPFGKLFSHSWPKLLFWVLLFSLLVICSKELFDLKISINEIVSDVLGLFLGTAIISLRFLRRRKILKRVGDREVLGKTISLRSTMQLIESVERRSAYFYAEASRQIKDPKASRACKYSARDSLKYANRIAYTLSSWKKQNWENDFSKSLEKAFSADQIFSLNFSPSNSAKEVLQIALLHERAKLSLFSKFQGAFRELWQIMCLKLILDDLSGETKKLESILKEMA